MGSEAEKLPGGFLLLWLLMSGCVFEHVLLALSEVLLLDVIL